jgi:acyl-lipid Delta6-acetylenase / acyl-lipid (9-3)-desaturase
MLICCIVGFSMGWWKNQHNVHHAIPNLHESEHGACRIRTCFPLCFVLRCKGALPHGLRIYNAQFSCIPLDAHDGDPDIDTLPFCEFLVPCSAMTLQLHLARFLSANAVAWSDRLARKTIGPRSSKLAQALVKRQQWLYFPLLLFARIIWAVQSFSFAFKINAFYWDIKAESGEAKLPRAVPDLFLQRLALVIHYGWYVSFMVFYMTPLGALIFFLTSQCFAGLLIAIVFGVGHNAMTIYDADKKPGFSEHQITTTRNIDDGPFTSWFMGGLQFQIE